jgi:hypothetical protein
MSPEKITLLYERYPVIFAQRHRPLQESLMGFGFSCQDGWFDLIDELCATLQTGVDRGDFLQIKAVQVKGSTRRCASISSITPTKQPRRSRWTCVRDR